MIRQARPEDAAEVVPILKQILDDMEIPIFQVISEDKFVELVEKAFVLPDYRYSYQNILVEEVDGKIVSMMAGYPAEFEENIDAPLFKLIDEEGIDISQFDHIADTESWPGEWYIDSLAVHPLMHGKGYGKHMLEFLPDFVRAKGEKILSLNVDVNNESAQKLYDKMGYKKVGELYIGSHLYNHMQLDLDNIN